MYFITITDNDGQRVLLKAQTENRLLALAVVSLAEENPIAVEVVDYEKPR